MTTILPRVVTARYAAFARHRPELGGVSLVPVRISVGAPKFIPGADRWPSCGLLMPWGLLGLDDWDEFTARYWARLDKAGPAKIARALYSVYRQHGERPLALLCFEDVTKPGARCHRRVWADYWLSYTGQLIPELDEVDCPDGIARELGA